MGQGGFPIGSLGQLHSHRGQPDLVSWTRWQDSWQLSSGHVTTSLPHEQNWQPVLRSVSVAQPSLQVTGGQSRFPLLTEIMGELCCSLAISQFRCLTQVNSGGVMQLHLTSQVLSFIVKGAPTSKAISPILHSPLSLRVTGAAG